MEEFLRYFTYSFIWRAIIGGALVALNCGLLGPFLVLQRLSLLSDGYGHVALAGVAIGILLGINPLITILAVVLMSSMIIRSALRKNLFSDAWISLLVSFGVAVSTVIIGAVRGFNADLYSYLIGSLYTLSVSELIYIAVVFFCTVVYLKVFYRSIFFITFNYQLAELSGGRHYKLAQNIFLFLTAINVVITIRAIGILLVSSMIVIPSLTALRSASSMRVTLIHSSMFALIALLCGIALALMVDVPPSGVIVLFLLLFFALVHIRKRKIT